MIVALGIEINGHKKLLVKLNLLQTHKKLYLIIIQIADFAKCNYKIYCFTARANPAQL